jgi:starch phosphorylase
MRDAMSNIGMMEPVREALKPLNVDLDDLIALEPDAALGNGGLGRLAACFMESDGDGRDPGLWLRHPLRERHVPPGDERRLAGRTAGDWLAHGNPWEFERRESAYEIGFGGTWSRCPSRMARRAFVWKPAEHVLAVGL